MELDTVINVGLTSIGLAMLCYGGNWLVNGSVIIAKKFRISNLIIGMTVVAYGTSTPELATSIAAAGEHSGIILGNVIGSNIANIGLVIGVSAIMIPLVVKRTTLKKEMPLMVGFSLLLIALSLDGEVSSYDGFFLVGLLIVFTVYTYRNAKSRSQEDVAPTASEKNSAYIRAIGLMGIGIVFLYFGAVMTVDNAAALAQTFGLSERIIGLTIIAIGTSLPELITSVLAIKKGHTDIGVGNIIGSNIYNVLMIMGVTAAIAGVEVADKVFYDYIIMIAFSFGLFLLMLSGIINRKMGLGFTAAYLVYLATSFIN